MAKLEIELSEEVRSLLRQRTERTGESEADVVESALKRELRAPVMSGTKPEMTHEEWTRRLETWVDSLPRTDVHLTNEDLRRANMYDDERK